MKKYIMLMGVLLAGTYLQAAERLTFYTVLSKPVGSFWHLETDTCAYPSLLGDAGSQSQQMVVNFGPTGDGGSILLKGGPMKIDTLLLEDESEFSTNGPMLFSPVIPSVSDSGGKLIIYPEGKFDANYLLIDTLILPKDAASLITVDNKTVQVWPRLEAQQATLNQIGAFNFNQTTTLSKTSIQPIFRRSQLVNNGTTGDTLKAEDGTTYNYYLMVKENP